MRTPRPVPRRPIAVGLAVLAIVLAARFVVPLPWIHAPRSDVDFPAYHEAARLVLSGEAGRMYSDEFKEFQNLPVVAALLSPLGAMGYDAAWTALWWINLASIVATLGVLLACIRRWYGPLDASGAGIACAIYLAFAPIFHRSLVLGQTTPVLVLAFAGAFALLRSGRPGSAGALLGVIALVKIPPALVVVAMLARRRLRAAGAAAVVLVAAVAVSLAAFGIALNAEYVQRVLGANAAGALAAHNNQSLMGTFLRLMTDRGLADWRLLPPSDAVRWVHGAALLGVAAVVALGARGLAWPAAPPDDRDVRVPLEAELGLAVAAMLLVFPIAWIHYFQFLVVPLTLLPFWWRRVGLPVRWGDVATLAAGGVLAAGTAVRAGAYYRAFEDETWFRWLAGSRTLAAALLLVGFARVLHACTRRPGPEA